MRDIILSLIVFGLLPSCYRRPFVGLLMFTWLGYMRVQDLTWGWAKHFRWSYYVMLATFAGFIFNRRPGQRWFLPDLRCYAMIALVVLLGLGIVVCDRPNTFQFGRYLEYVKIVVIALFTTAVVTDREKLRLIIWVIGLSFGFYGFKSGLWGLLTGGQTQILRGPGGMLADNNDFSLALSMAVPILFLVGWTERKKNIKRAFWVCLPLTYLTILFTRSRGGFLSVGAATMVMIWRSKNRIMGLMIVGLFGLGALMMMPQQYRDRLSTITKPTEEGSAASRLRAWGIAYRMATANPVLGVGFGKFPQHFLEFCHDPTPQELNKKGIIVAHSSYMQMWSESGTPAFALYLTLIFTSFFTCWKVRGEAMKRYHSSWLISYATMFEASLLAFAVGATFLNRAHFDLFYHWVALIIVFGQVAKKELEGEGESQKRVGRRGHIRAVRARGFGIRPRSRAFRSAVP